MSGFFLPDAPTIDVGPSDDHILTDREYSLTCMVEGAPFPEVIWLKDGQELNYTDRVGLRVFDASLHFTSTELEDAGIYQCLVENVNGSASSLNATLSLTGMYVLKCFAPSDYAEAISSFMAQSVAT